MGTIFRRELKGYFDSPMGFGIIGAFVVVIMLLSVLLDPAGSGGNWFERGELSMRTFFGIFPWVAAVVVPAVSMRLWSEDRRQATFELLMTLPIPTWRIALGKYFAGLVFLVCMLLATAAFPLMLMYFGSPDWGPVFGGYIACFLLGAAFVAVGLFVSGLTENQALSFFLAMLICLGIIGWTFFDPANLVAVGLSGVSVGLVVHAMRGRGADDWPMAVLLYLAMAGVLRAYFFAYYHGGALGRLTWQSPQSA